MNEPKDARQYSAAAEATELRSAAAIATKALGEARFVVLRDDDHAWSGNDASPGRHGPGAPVAAGDLKQGDTIRDVKGDCYRVHISRHHTVTAHPIIDGKAQVSADTSVRFFTHPDPEITAAGDNDRRDPIYLAGQGQPVTQPRWLPVRPNMAGHGFFTEAGAQSLAQLASSASHPCRAVDFVAHLLRLADELEGMANAEADEAQARDRAAARYAAAGGDPTVISSLERAEDVARAEALRERLVNAVSAELGLAMPPPGSPARDAFAIKLAGLVESVRLDREELFDENVRKRLQEVCFWHDYQNDALDLEWSKEVFLDGHQGIRECPDAELLERVVRSGEPLERVITLTGVAEDGPDLHGLAFLNVLASARGEELCRAWIDDLALDFLADTARALDAAGIANPYEDLLRPRERPAG